MVATGAGCGLLNSARQFSQKYHATWVLGVVGGRGLILVLSQKRQVISAILDPLDGALRMEFVAGPCLGHEVLGVRRIGFELLA